MQEAVGGTPAPNRPHLIDKNAPASEGKPVQPRGSPAEAVVESQGMAAKPVQELESRNWEALQPGKVTGTGHLLWQQGYQELLLASEPREALV